MKNIPTFENFINESKLTSIDEALQENGLDFATSHALQKTLRFRSAKGYKDGIDHKPLFTLFHYDAGWPSAGLRPSYFTKSPGAQFKEVAKSAADYLRSGKATAPIIEFLAFIYTDAAPGGRSQGAITEAIERIEPSFTLANKDLPAMKDALTNLIEVLKSWSTGTPAARLNLAVAVNKECNYSAYSGADFEIVYKMVIAGLRKNKIKLTPDSKIEINKDVSRVDSKTISNSIGFTQVDITELSSSVTIDVDGTNYFVGSFESSIGYGRY
jgi:hypothetical protein